MDISLRQLRTFRELAERGTVTAVAESLGYTPSAISQQLATLERSVGVPLTERSGRRLQLTDAGRELLGHAVDLLERAEVAQVAVERSMQDPRGRVDVGILESVVGGIFVPALARLAVAAPDVEVHSYEMLDPDLGMKELLNGGLDLVFSIDYPHAPGSLDEGLQRRPLSRDRYFLVVPEDDELPNAPVPLDSVAEHDWIAFSAESNCGRSIIAAARSAGFEPRIRHQIESFPAMLRLVAAGVGVALVPSMALQHPPRGVRMLETTTLVERQIDLVHRCSSSGRPALEAFIDAVLTMAPECREPALAMAAPSR